MTTCVRTYEFKGSKLGM